MGIPREQRCGGRRGARLVAEPVVSASGGRRGREDLYWSDLQGVVERDGVGVVEMPQRPRLCAGCRHGTRPAGGEEHRVRHRRAALLGRDVVLVLHEDVERPGRSLFARSHPSRPGSGPRSPPRADQPGLLGGQVHARLGGDRAGDTCPRSCRGKRGRRGRHDPAARPTQTANTATVAAARTRRASAHQYKLLLLGLPIGQRDPRQSELGISLRGGAVSE